MVQSRRAAPSKATADAVSAETSGPRILKKYPNRRLYDTETSSYITLADVKKMVLTGQDFVVRDAKTSDDLTRSILLQIILEEETGGVPMFSTQMLAQIIRFYGHAMQGVMGTWLEKNLQALTELQARFAPPGALHHVRGQLVHRLGLSGSPGRRGREVEPGERLRIGEARHCAVGRQPGVPVRVLALAGPLRVPGDLAGHGRDFLFQCDQLER